MTRAMISQPHGIIGVLDLACLVKGGVPGAGVLWLVIGLEIRDDLAAVDWSRLVEGHRVAGRAAQP
jgi:hypothetical protein